MFANMCPTAGIGSSPSGMTVWNGHMYFSAAGDGACSDYELYRTDGTNAPTIVNDINPGGSSNPKVSVVIVIHCVALFHAVYV